MSAVRCVCLYKYDAMLCDDSAKTLILNDNIAVLVKKDRYVFSKKNKNNKEKKICRYLLDFPFIEFVLLLSLSLFLCLSLSFSQTSIK